MRVEKLGYRGLCMTVMFSGSPCNQSTFTAVNGEPMCAMHRKRHDETPSTATLTLPWRTPPLSLNQRLHWAAKARLSRTVRDVTQARAKADKVPAFTVPVIVTLHYRQKVQRPIDADNLYATVKPALDGLRDAGVLRDDTSAHVTPLVEIHEAVPGEPGVLWLTIEVRS